MIEVAYRQNSNKSNNGTTRNHHASPVYHPSPLRNSPEFGQPLQIKPLKAPSSPLNTKNAKDTLLRKDQVATSSGATRFSKRPSSHNNMSFLGMKDDGAQEPSSRSHDSKPPHRVRKGQKLEEWQNISAPKELPLLQQIDSPFQTQEYLSMLIRVDPHNVHRITALPQSSSLVSGSLPSSPQVEKGKNKQGLMSLADDDDTQVVDTDVWVYEQIR